MLMFENTSISSPESPDSNPYYWPQTDWRTEIALAIMLGEMKASEEDRQRAIYRAEAPAPPRNIRDAIISGNED